MPRYEVEVEVHRRMTIRVFGRSEEAAKEAAGSVVAKFDNIITYEVGGVTMMPPQERKHV